MLSSKNSSKAARRTNLPKKLCICVGVNVCVCVSLYGYDCKKEKVSKPLYLFKK